MSTELSRTYNNSQLAKIISQKYPEYHTHEVEDMLRLIPFTIEELIAEGHSVKIMNFGVFSSKKNNDRYTKHPQTGVWQLFKGNLTIRFNAARSLLDRLRKRGKEDEVSQD